jgi:hypothetical protein
MWPFHLGRTYPGPLSSSEEEAHYSLVTEQEEHLGEQRR